MKTKTTSRTIRAQAAELQQIWQELLALQGHLRAALPADLARAKAKLGAHDAENPRGGYPLQTFHRLASVFVQQQRALTMGEISDALGVPLSSATRMVDALVEQGYAERLPDPQDRRIVRVALTANARQLYELFNQFFSERMCQFLTHFDANERLQLLKLFRKTVMVLQQLDTP